ncbi:MAG: ComEC/Rec2 family competence protein [Proteiniphilum sp.]
MNAFIGKTPFLRLLLPVITGILLGLLFPVEISDALRLSILGLLLMLLSYFIGDKNQYKHRWIFGAGVCLFLCSLSILQYRTHEKESQFVFPEVSQYYTGTVLDIPEVKPRSIACNVKTSYPFQRKIKLYLAQDPAARELKPGDEILFYARLQPFRNFGNPDDFDYVRFMKIKGFTGSAYISEINWQKTGRQSHAIPVQAQRLRERALHMYRSLISDKETCAFISALTLGYKSDLSDDLQEAFRASGTAHVLAVSGLHVGIIYGVINLLFSFLGKSGRRYILRQWLVILLLWLYVFVAGGSASVVRATIMLTIFCLGNMQHMKGFTYNTLAAAAFFILILHPFSLFDVSFQMSFGAVAAILCFQPKLQALYAPKNRAVKYVWNLFTVSTAAQLGVFPLVLYYFGTFPTWFFITNLLVVPLIGIIIYAAIVLITVGSIPVLHTGFTEAVQSVLQWIAETLSGITLRIVYIAESLPFSQLSNSYISLFQLLLLFTFIFLFAQFLFTHRSRPLIIALASLFVFQLTVMHGKIGQSVPQLVVFNQTDKSEIALYVNGKRHFLEIPENGILPHPGRRILRLSDSSMAGYHADKPFQADVLILSQNAFFSMEQLRNLFNPSVIVLDSSIPRRAANRMNAEYQQLGIDVHDVTQKGAFSVNYSYLCPLTSKGYTKK